VEEVLAGMNAGIGTAAAYNFGWLPQENGERVFDGLLYAGAVGLPLQTVEPRTLVGYFGKISG
jgi:hypothetical protein